MVYRIKVKSNSQLYDNAAIANNIIARVGHNKLVGRGSDTCSRKLRGRCPRIDCSFFSLS